MPVYRFPYLFVINNATRQHFTLVIRIVLMFMCAAGFLEICFTAAERVSVSVRGSTYLVNTGRGSLFGTTS